MPRWPRNENTGRTVENCKTHPDGLPCPDPECISMNTKFMFLNNKKKTQPRYKCLECNQGWQVGGKIRGFYDKSGREVMSNPMIPDTPPQPPIITASRPPPPTAAAVHEFQGRFNSS